jgi:protein-L-isoaspartate(D-aspartate) O-methyltransferase
VDGLSAEPVDRSSQPREWLELAFRDDFVLTQLNDGVVAGGGTVTDVDFISSASMPAVVAKMLAALRAESGMRVLEIGTGTGWNAALLAYRLGAEDITAVEIDPALYERAQDALVRAGYDSVHVVCADGTRGYAAGAPYDRVLSTACVYHVPYEWVAQTRPGGLVVTPWAATYINGHLLVLTVRDDGAAVGRIAGRVAFMPVCGQRVPRIAIDDVVTPESEGCAEEDWSTRHPRWYVASYDARTAIGTQVDHCKWRYTPPDDDNPDGILWFLDQWSDSWAAIHHQPEQPGPYRVRQYGPRRLFDKVSAAYQTWKNAGKPPASAWTITVTPDGQHAELPRNRREGHARRATEVDHSARL